MDSGAKGILTATRGVVLSSFVQHTLWDHAFDRKFDVSSAFLVGSFRSNTYHLQACRLLSSGVSGANVANTLLFLFSQQKLTP